MLPITRLFSSRVASKNSPRSGLVSPAPAINSLIFLTCKHTPRDLSSSVTSIVRFPVDHLVPARETRLYEVRLGLELLARASQVFSKSRAYVGGYCNRQLWCQSDVGE